MKQNSKLRYQVVLAAVLLTGFGAAHLIDDFLYGVPADFGLSNQVAQVLAVVYFVITSWLLVLAVLGQKAGYIGNMILGLFLLTADMSKHGMEGMFWGSWRTGLFSRFLAFSVMGIGLWLAIVSYKAWQDVKADTL
jgi:hypothetical protein